MTFNIVLWLGLAIAIGLLVRQCDRSVMPNSHACSQATCYAIGGMDPGRNTSIYRTPTHAKSH